MRHAHHLATRPAENAAMAPKRRRIRTVTTLVAVLVSVGLAYVLVHPVAIAVPPVAGSPAADWSEAIARVDAIVANEAADPAILPDCRTRLIDHGGPTADVIV